MKKIILISILVFLSSCSIFNTENKQNTENINKIQKNIVDNEIKNNIDKDYEKIVIKNIHDKWIKKITIEELEKENPDRSIIQDWPFIKFITQNKEIFLINEHIYTKKMYEKLIKIYHKLWRICEKNEKKDVLWLVMNCEKWKFWEYSNKWKKIDFQEYSSLLTEKLWEKRIEDINKERKKEDKQREVALKNLNSFKKAFYETNIFWKNLNVWDDCPWMLKFYRDKNWVTKKEYDCDNWKIIKINYFFDNNFVSKNKFLLYKYLEEKKKYSQALKFKNWLKSFERFKEEVKKSNMYGIFIENWWECEEDYIMNIFWNWITSKCINWKYANVKYYINWEEINDKNKYLKLKYEKLKKQYF